MTPSIEEIFAIDRAYLKQNHSLPTSVSDWHLTDALYDLPISQHFDGLRDSPYGLSDYLFSDSRKIEKEIILSYVQRNLGLHIDDFSVSIFTNTTAAIFSLLIYLTSNREARVLVQTPFYFSIAAALKFCSAHGVMFHVRSDENYSFDVDSLIRMVDDQAIDVAVLTDPAYCTGVRNTEKILSAVAALADRNVLCIVDGSAGGFDEVDAPPILEPLYVDAVSRFRNLFYIDSPTKRTLINSAKHALIFGDPATLERVEGLADHFAGSLSREQLSVLSYVFSDYAAPAIKRACRNNALRLAQGLSFASVACSEYGGLSVSPRVSGLYALVHRVDVRQRALGATAFYEVMLKKFNVRALPGHLFGVSNADSIAIRINLLRHPAAINKAIAALSELYVNST